MIEKFLKSTALVTYEVTQGNEVGTGFFVFRTVHDNQGHVFLVTNKHVLPPTGYSKSIKIRVTTGPAEKSIVRFVEIPIIGQDGRYLSNTRLHPNPGFDIAAVNITDSINKELIRGSWLPIELLVTQQMLKDENITVGDDIFLLGFPDAIFDARNIFPILRTGVIATVPSEGYSFNDRLRGLYGLPDRLDGFLIDANVFPGSSGSVVILKPQPVTIGPQGETEVSGRKKIPYILGIISGSIPISDTALGSNQRMGLGIVYSAEAIRSVIELFYQK